MAVFCRLPMASIAGSDWAACLPKACAARSCKKTPDPGTIEGGVSGVLSLESIRPLESKRQGLTLVVRGLYEDIAADFKDSTEVRPFGIRGEATYVTKLADNFGIAITYAGLRNYNTFAGTLLENYRVPDGPNDFDGNGNPDVLPITAGPAITHFNTERHNAIGMVQWEPVDWLRVSVDGIFSEEYNDNPTRRYFAQGVFNRNLGAPDSVTVENDSVTQFSGTVVNYRGVINNNRIKDHTYGGGLNFEIDDGGPLTLNADFSYFDAGRERFTPTVFFETDGNTPVAARQQFSYDIRDQDNVVFGFNTSLTADDFNLFGGNVTEQNSSDVIQAARMDFKYDSSTTGFLGSILFGGRYDNRRHTQDVNNLQYNFGALGTRPDLDSSFLARDSNPYTSRSSILGGETATSFPYYDFDKLFALAQTAGTAGQFAQNLGAGADIEEDTFALYAQANLQLGAISGNVGVRYVLTDTVSSGLAGTNPNNAVAQEFSNTYDYFLPSANLRINVTDDLIFRLAGSRTISRPLFEELSVGSTFNLPDNPALPIQITTGNPNLQPFTSDGVDATIEWYPNPGTFVSVAGYYKWVSNFTTSQTRTGSITLPSGEIRDTNVTEFINDPDTLYFRGLEFQLRKDFDFLPGLFSNLGVQANYNYNETDVRETFTSLAGPTAVATQVQVLPINLSKHVVNGILYYDSELVDFRVAYRYFSEYSRRFVNGYQLQPEGQLDFNFGIRVAKGFRVIGTVTNILGAEIVRLTEDSRNTNNDALLQNYIQKGRDFALGVRVNF